MSNVYLSRSTTLYLIKIRNPIFLPDHSIHNNVTLGNGVGSCLYEANLKQILHIFKFGPAS